MRIITFFALFCPVFFAAFPSFAFRLEPMIAELFLVGDKSSQSFRIENNGKERVAIQIKMTGRLTTLEGEEKRDPTSDFTIYPEQVSLAPNDTKTIRITYKGPTNLQEEKAYRLIATQLPVDFNEAKGTKPQLNFLFQYIASVYVLPAGVAAKMEIHQAKVISPNQIEFQIANTGTAHRLMKGIEVHISTADNKPVALDEKFLKDIENENFLAKSRRRWLVNVKEKLDPQTKLKAELQIKE
jgi:fimbrial chaperone protein